MIHNRTLQRRATAHSVLCVCLSWPQCVRCSWTSTRSSIIGAAWLKSTLMHAYVQQMQLGGVALHACGAGACLQQVAQRSCRAAVGCVC